MAGPEQNFNVKRPQGNLSDVLDELKKNISRNLNCHHIGIIERVNTQAQTVEVRIAYKKTYFRKTRPGEHGTDFYTPHLEEYPLLLDVPFIVLTGGEFSLRLPIRQGDTCLVLFNDRSIDRWFETGQVNAVDATRAHHLSDGIALVGLRSSLNRLENFSAERAELRGDSACLSLGEKIKIENNDENLGSIMRELIDTIRLAAINTPQGPGAFAPGTAAQLNTIAEKFERLLD